MFDILVKAFFASLGLICVVGTVGAWVVLVRLHRDWIIRAIISALLLPIIVLGIICFEPLVTHLSR